MVCKWIRWGGRGVVEVKVAKFKSAKGVDVKMRNRAKKKVGCESEKKAGLLLAQNLSLNCRKRSFWGKEKKEATKEREECCWLRLLATPLKVVTKCVFWCSSFSRGKGAPAAQRRPARRDAQQGKHGRACRPFFHSAFSYRTVPGAATGASNETKPRD